MRKNQSNLVCNFRVSAFVWQLETAVLSPYFRKFQLEGIGWSTMLCFSASKVANWLRKIYLKQMIKEWNYYLVHCFRNTLYTGNLKSGPKRTPFTCTQCMINNKNLECLIFLLIFQFFVWVPHRNYSYKSTHIALQFFIINERGSK